jgi:hypothetical protein
MPTIPTTMRAAAIDEFGGPDFLKLHTLQLEPLIFRSGNLMVPIASGN